MECDDYEADDIIGTLSLQADNEMDSEGNCVWDTIIVSSDLDMLQIVDENTRMYRLLKGFSDLEELDVAGVEAKYGIKKAQFLDLKALKGDTSDNIPGVPGIGEKTAVKLLNEYGSLEGIYENIDKITGKTCEKLEAGKDSAFMSYQLGKIMFDAPVKLADVPDLIINGERIIAELKKLEFFSLVRKFADELGAIEVPQEKEDEAAEVKPLPEGLLVFDDVKQKMHNDPEVAEKVLSGVKFWDLNQGKFLIDPIGAKMKDGSRQMSFDFVADETDDAKEYWREAAEFEKMPKLHRIMKSLDMPLIPVLFKMEKRGMKISRAYFGQLKEEFTGVVSSLEQKICSISGTVFNVNSSAQLSIVLFEKLGLPTTGIKKTKNGFSTGVKELEKLKDKHEVIPLIMEYREMSKLLSTYIAPFPDYADENDRIHTTFTQNVTATGRLSSLNPNLQNIPVRTEEGKRIRAGFVADEGKMLVSADYSQFELRLAAVLSGDQALIDDFNSGVDIHTKTAADVFGVEMDQVTKTQRRAAKVINFGVLYGMSAKGLADAAGMSVTEAKKFIEDYNEVRRPIRDYLDKVLTQAREKGYVETHYGRRKPTPDVKSPNFLIRQAAERAAANMPIQGTEADLMKKAMIQVDGKLPDGAGLVMQVHDSLIVECGQGQVEEVTTILREVMEGVAPELPIKLAVEVTNGENWGKL